MWDPFLPDFAYSQPFIRAGFCSPLLLHVPEDGSGDSGADPFPLVTLGWSPLPGASWSYVSPFALRGGGLMSF